MVGSSNDLNTTRGVFDACCIASAGQARMASFYGPILGLKDGDVEERNDVLHTCGTRVIAIQGDFKQFDMSL